jgi:hypothetical protein
MKRLMQFCLSVVLLDTLLPVLADTAYYISPAKTLITGEIKA